MPYIYIYIFASIFVISLASFAGAIALFFSKEYLHKITLFLVSLSAGTLLGGALLHLMPEVIEKNADNFAVWIWLLLGIISFFSLEKVICWNHCHVPTSEEHPHSFGILNLVGDALHNFLDGIVIAGSFLVSIPLGITTSIAVLIHEIPQEIADFGVLVYAGYSRKKALLFNFLIALTSFLGAILAILIGQRLEGFSTFIIPFTAGGFIYIAVADLIPELKKENKPLKSLGYLIFILLGIGIMLGLKFIFE